MIELKKPNEWQFIDDSNGLVFPWYVKPFLDELATWDLKDKIVFEYGCGASTLWWASKCKKLYGVESDDEYFSEVANKIGDRACIEYEPDPAKYVQCIGHWNMLFDIVVIDGMERDACVPVALEHLKEGGILIIDNYLQPSVHMASPDTQRILNQYPCEVFRQKGHPDWQTAIFVK